MRNIYIKLTEDDKNYDLCIDGVHHILPYRTKAFDIVSSRARLFSFLEYLMDNKLPAAKYLADYYRCRQENYLCVIFDFRGVINELAPDEINDNAFVRELLPCVSRIMQG